MLSPEAPDANCPGKWLRLLRLALDSIVIVLMNAYLLGGVALAEDESVHEEAPHSPAVYIGPDGRLAYARDDKGNRLPDFSHVGYHAAEATIPDVPVKITLGPGRGDDTRRIQEGLEALASLPADANGFRGALLLKRGVYRVGGSLVMSHSGVVLRGEGDGPDGTVIIAAGYDKLEYQRALITIGPDSGRSTVHTHHGTSPGCHVKVLDPSRQEIVDDYVPVGSHVLTVKSAAGYGPGDRIVVYRPSTAEWIRSIGCDRLEPKWKPVKNPRWVKDGDRPGFSYERPGSYSTYWIPKRSDESWDDFVKRVPLSADEKTFDFTRQWSAGEYDFYFERSIVAVDGNRVTIDAPIVHAMEKQYGGGAIYHYETPDRVYEVGVENLRLISEFAEPTEGHPYGSPDEVGKAENHAWHGIQLQTNTENTWVRDVTGNYFGKSLVTALGRNATVQDCVNLGHASKITGGRRYPFTINGQLNLVQRCVSYEGRHEYVTQMKTAGPNVFVDCLALNSKAIHGVGPHHRYSVGVLFDNVKAGGTMESAFYGNRGTGHGWGGAQICFYNCIAPNFQVESPPGGTCWKIGCSKDGTGRVSPRGLYYQQLEDRLGSGAVERVTTEAQRNGTIYDTLTKEIAR